MLLLVRIANVVLCVHTREVSKQFVVNKPLILKYRMLEYKLKKKIGYKIDIVFSTHKQFMLCKRNIDVRFLVLNI